jgi:hypothetical protein
MRFFLRYKFIGVPKILKKWPRPPVYLGLKLTIHVIKIQVHLVRQSLEDVNCSGLYEKYVGAGAEAHRRAGTLPDNPVHPALYTWLPACCLSSLQSGKCARTL